MVWHMIPWIVTLGVSSVAAATDMAWRKIPNRLTFPALLAGFAWSGATAGGRGVADSAVAAVLLAVPYLLLFIFARGGAGDVKLMAAIGAWLGVEDGIIALACISGAGIVMGIGWTIARGNMPRFMRNCQAILWKGYSAAVLRVSIPGPREQQLRMPYGVVILVGVGAGALGVLIW